MIRKFWTNKKEMIFLSQNYIVALQLSFEIKKIRLT